MATSEHRLLEFLQDRDVPCPSCDYNLRDLTEPRCPECRRELFLTVGVVEAPVTPLLIACAPGMFSGIAATLVLGVMVLHPGAPLWVFMIDVFGFSSGVTAIGLVLKRRRFTGLPVRRQLIIALAIWTVHIAAFALLIINV